ncbi:ZinT family metal-binding protein [Alkalibacterium sp. f15]|uniref:ZinT family metal-binding protein n=1 Tax=Alkalibacterium sp. f15 TaxID=3414029 RepID=UPI003BF905F0
MNEFIKWSSLISSVLLLAACQEVASDEVVTNDFEDVEESQKNGINLSASAEIEIKGLAHHYHTGDEIELSAELTEDVGVGNWNWHIKNSDEDQWEVVNGLDSHIFSREATTNGSQIKAVVKDDDDEVMYESEVMEVVIDDHHGNDEETRRIYNGFFYNTEIEDRELSDWEGEWQSVNQYLLSGVLDPVFESKAAEDGSMTFDEYKDYYTVGYETDVEDIVIEDDSFTFFYEDGKEIEAEYEYDGYEILVYEKGNRGVRFVYNRVGGSDDMPQYIQFSDHIISPEESDHFHLYWGDDREALLDEVINWPTYYPSNLDTVGLVRDMLAH